MTDGPTAISIGKFSALCLKATFGFWGAWLFWRMAVPGFEAFAVFAAIFALGGAISAGKALVFLFRLVRKMGVLGGFRRKGAAPKADPMPDEDALSAKGLLR